LIYNLFKNSGTSRKKGAVKFRIDALKMKFFEESSEIPLSSKSELHNSNERL